MANFDKIQIQQEPPENPRNRLNSSSVQQIIQNKPWILSETL